MKKNEGVSGFFIVKGHPVKFEAAQGAVERFALWKFDPQKGWRGADCRYL